MHLKNLAAQGKTGKNTKKRNQIMDSNRAFGLRDKIGYALGDFGNDFTFMMSSMFLMKFYTDVMGVSAAAIGIMMMVCRFADAFTDITMGQIVDRSRTTANGKFRPWLLRMMVPVAFASMLMYANWFRGMPMGFKVVWMFTTYLLWGSFCFTGITIPYGSMASAITSDPRQRSELSTWRALGATMAATACGVIIPMLVYRTDERGYTVLDGARVSTAAFICSCLAVLCYLLCYKLTTERVKLEQSTEKFSFINVGKKLFTSRSLIGIVLIGFVFMLAQLSLTGMLAYIFPNYFGSGTGQSLASIIGTGVTLVCSGFVVPLTVKIGKKALGVLAAVLGSAMLFLSFIVHTRSMMVFIAFYIMSYITIAVFNLIIWAMITDVIDDMEVKSGKRSDGTVYALSSFARKMGQAASSGLIGMLLTMIGYSSASAYDADVVNGIYSITCVVPAVGYAVLALILLFVYPLGKEAVESNAQKLKAAR